MRKGKRPAHLVGILLCGLLCVLLSGIPGTGGGAEMVKGKVASVQGDAVELDVGATGGVGAGMRAGFFIRSSSTGKRHSFLSGSSKSWRFGKDRPGANYRPHRGNQGRVWSGDRRPPGRAGGDLGAYGRYGFLGSERSRQNPFGAVKSPLGPAPGSRGKGRA